MKKTFTLISFLFTAFFSQAQWSNTTNQFYDTLHMPVAVTDKDQQKPIIVKSYPDSGYFVMWLDARTTGNGTDIYAQKFDKGGKALWATNGVPVITGPDYQTYAPPSNADYRYYSHACTDSAGGFYVAWDDDNGTASGSTIAHRVCVQHIKNDGSAVFAYPGYVVAASDAAHTYQYTSPQLIADGNKGFFIGYLKLGGYNDLYVQCMRDEGGTMVSYGGGQMDFNGINVQTLKACGIGNDRNELDARVTGFDMYPDLQGGCSVVMTMDWNTGGNERVFTGFNKLCRVKKESHVTTMKRSNDIANAVKMEFTYKKDSVIRLYNYRTYFNAVFCGGSGGPAYSYTNYYVENGGNGYLQISDLLYNTEYVKGTMVPTGGNVNVNVIAANQRNLVNESSVGSWFQRVYYLPDEIYDSIPYQLASDLTHPYYAYRTSPEGKTLDTLIAASDTLMGKSAYDYDFALASSGNRVFASGLFYDFPTYSTRYLKLQQLQIDRTSATSFATHLHTGSKLGVTIGREVSTGFTGTDITYDDPLITTDLRGNALFCITELGRGVRVSPIGDSAQLVWGPMGKLIGSGLYHGNYYYPENPHVVMNPTDGTAVVVWDDTRYIAPNSTGSDIYMRHLDSLKIFDYAPPIQPLMTLSYGGAYLLPGVLNGTTGKWGVFEALNGTTRMTTPVLSLTDTYNLGSISGSVYDYLQDPIRTYNGKPYLSRNYLIKPENNPAGAASIGVRFYFTNSQFKQLQTADPSITSPADLIFIKQAASVNTAPGEYTPVTGEQLVIPSSWQAVDSGYYIELQVSSFSNFFIKKNDGILPVTWLSVSAQRTVNNYASVTWAVTDEINVKSYTVQSSTDGIIYGDACTVGAANLTQYHCSVAVSGDKKYYFRIKETDFEGRTSLSKTVWLDKLQQGMKFIISPNPAKQNATLVYTMPTGSAATLRLTNSTGIMVWQQATTLSTSGTISVPLTHLASGTYHLQIITAQTSQTIKVIKE